MKKSNRFMIAFGLVIFIVFSYTNKGHSEDAVVAFAKMTYPGDAYDGIIFLSDVKNNSLLTMFGRLFMDPKYDIKNLKGDCLSGRVMMRSCGFDILRRDKVPEADISMVSEASQQYLINVNKKSDDLDKADAINKIKAESFGVNISPPEGWKGTVDLGIKGPFIRIGENGALCPIVSRTFWITGQYNDTMASIEVIVFKTKNFSIEAVAQSPREYVNPGNKLGYTSNGITVASGMVRLGNNQCTIIWSTYETSNLDGKKYKLQQELVFLRNDRAVVAISLEARIDKFEEMNDSVFFPLLESIVLKNLKETKAAEK
jgi:hypothetical protein